MVAKKDQNADIIPARGAEITDQFLRGIGKVSGDAFEDAMRLAEQIYGEVGNFADEMGNGFAVLKDKTQLVGVKSLFLRWRWHDGDFGDFVSAAVVTATGGRYVINDGSSGIAAQLRDYEQEHPGKDGGMVAYYGLRESSYSTCKACGKPRDSRTDECFNTLSNGSVCGDTDTARGTESTFYIDLTGEAA
jgi:hypothetical protein